MNNMAPQEVFNKVAKHLFDQGEPATLDDDPEAFLCVMLSPKGNMCAIGKLLEHLPKEDRLNNAGCDEFCSLQNQYGELLQGTCCLVGIHDNKSNWHSTDTMRFALDAVAHKHNLDNSILATLKFKDR